MTTARKMDMREEVARMRSLMHRYAVAVDDGDRAEIARLEAEIKGIVGPEVGSADRAGFLSPYARKIRKRGG